MQTPAIRYTVPPFPLSRVRPQHVPGVFGRFEDVVGAHLAILRRSRGAEAAERAAFFEFLLAEVDAGGYAELQRQTLERARALPDLDLPKYLDPVVWFDSKLRIARRLGLHQRPPVRILDIGTGPGHFPLVARFFGHEVTGTDLPAHTGPAGAAADDLYDGLCAIYKVRRVRKTILPFGALDGVGEGYAVVTALLAAFNVHPDRSPWGVAEWDHFLAALAGGVLAAEGELYMSLAENKLTAAVWQHLSARAAWRDDPTRHLLLRGLAGAAPRAGG